MNFPPLTVHAQQRLRDGHVAILIALAAADMDAHAVAIDTGKIRPSICAWMIAILCSNRRA